MKILDQITSIDWQPKLNEIGEVVEGIADINQCIRIILSTPKGSVPHRPEFGADILKYIDNPITSAIPNIIREAVDAIHAWEPRVRIKSIRAEIIEHQVIFRIEWVLKGTEETQMLEVIV